MAEMKFIIKSMLNIKMMMYKRIE